MYVGADCRWGSILTLKDRCSKLDAINFAFLETLQLKSILILDNETPVMKNFDNFMSLNNIKLIKFESEFLDRELGETNSEWMVFKTETIQRVTKVLLNQNYYNLLMIDKTNVIVGILRKMCKWSCSSIIAEYRLLSGKNSNYYSEVFLDLVTIELMPPNPSTKRRKSFYQDTMESQLSQLKGTEDMMEIDDDDIEVENENEDQMLSASPQVPKNLLRMVELRKQKNKNNQVIASQQAGVDHEYEFYSTEQTFVSVNTIRIDLPSEQELPVWFKVQRNMWDEELRL